MASKTPAKAAPAGPNLDIQFDRASKFYEPSETVTGTCFVTGRTTDTGYDRYTLLAEAYMDTVSQIRGNMGRQPLPVNDRIYFMKKTEEVKQGGKFNPNEPLKFQFQLNSTGKPDLIDAYVGVDFSIVYKVTLTIYSGSTKPLNGEAQFYCKVANSGIDPKLGRKYVPQQFMITPEALTAPPGQKVPKFKFSG